VPSEASIGIAAPIIVILLRILQGLAVGGEHGGAMTYVAEHAPAGRKGRFTSFIQAGGPCGFLLSLVVVLACKAFMSEAFWTTVGWRVPFLFSFGLLAISLWMRLKLSESPIFQEMKAKGELTANPFVRSFTYPGNKKRLFVALFGVSAGMNVISYTATFRTLSFLESTMRMDETVAQMILVFTAIVAVSSTLFFGRLSDRIGRKASIVGSYILVLRSIGPSVITPIPN
jgi:MFS family permease